MVPGALGDQGPAVGPGPCRGRPGCPWTPGRCFPLLSGVLLLLWSELLPVSGCWTMLAWHGRQPRMQGCVAGSLLKMPGLTGVAAPSSQGPSGCRRLFLQDIQPALAATAAPDPAAAPDNSSSSADAVAADVAEGWVRFSVPLLSFADSCSSAEGDERTFSGCSGLLWPAWPACG